ncbi:MAG TPA: right-handed parallel beta-helix repeat-containing protein [Verrucomicrobiae bacterium]|nr:right-handed parallel beta-helix repeat-containing protein [Verrucomicrobiae bacterium]
MTDSLRRTAMFVIGSLVVVSVNVGATVYYVATNGNDSASGTSTNTPWRTPERGVISILAGDTLYVRGGTYMLTNQVKVAKAGVATNYCHMWAYPGEHPVFNATNLPSGDRGIYIGKDFWHVKGIEVEFAPDNGIIITSGSNIVEGCVIHDCGNDGMTIGSTSALGHDNLILNCDSYRNYTPGSSGNDGDGFSAKTGCGPNNVFEGCRSYLNSDDGWDFYDNDANTVILSNCWSFMNGSNQWNVSGFQGNGNGFKLGGSGTHARHTLKQCMAFDNHSKGFDYNLSVGGHTLLNCTSFRNVNPNYEFPVTPSTGTDVFENCISYLGVVDIIAGSIQVSNSWQNGLTVSGSDFVSLDSSLAFASRNPDYSLPTNGFARLAAGSDLIDAGINVGLPYNGSAPDLGAYEFVPVATPQQAIFIDAVSQTTTGLFLEVVGLTSHGPVIVYSSPDLMVWTPIFTNPPVTGTWQFTDPSATNSQQQFYQVQEQ